VIDIEEEYEMREGSEIRLKEGAKIIVASGSHLTLQGDKSYIAACSEMWNSIEVENGATLLINVRLKAVMQCTLLAECWVYLMFLTIIFYVPMLKIALLHQSITI